MNLNTILIIKVDTKSYLKTIYTYMYSEASGRRDVNF